MPFLGVVFATTSSSPSYSCESSFFPATFLLLKPFQAELRQLFCTMSGTKDIVALMLIKVPFFVEREDYHAY